MYLAARSCISCDLGPGGVVTRYGTLLTSTLAHSELYIDLPPCGRIGESRSAYGLAIATTSMPRSRSISRNLTGAALSVTKVWMSLKANVVWILVTPILLESVTTTTRSTQR